MMIETRSLEGLWKRYETQVYEYCKEQFEGYVKPYCIRHDCEFIAGNGTFYLSNWGKLFDEERDERLADDKHPLYEVLTETIPGMNWNCAGSLMPDYRRTNEH